MQSSYSCCRPELSIMKYISSKYKLLYIANEENATKKATAPKGNHTAPQQNEKPIRNTTQTALHTYILNFHFLDFNDLTTYSHCIVS